MSLPTDEELNTLDYAFGGEPWVGVAADQSIPNGTLDYAFGGEPFLWAEPPAVAGGQPRVFIST